MQEVADPKIDLFDNLNQRFTNLRLNTSLYRRTRIGLRRREQKKYGSRRRRREYRGETPGWKWGPYTSSTLLAIKNPNSQQMP